MLAYFISFKTFETYDKSTPYSWEVPLYTAYSDGGNITIPQNERKNYSGDWVYISDHLFIVEECSPKEGVIELKVSDPATIFSRKLIFPSSPESTYGNFIANRIKTEFINCPDPAYAISYLSVTNEDTTPFETPKVGQDGLYSLLDVIKAAREKGVVVDFLINKRTLNIRIHTNAESTHNIIFSDGHSTLNDETFSRVKVAKITVLKATEEEGEYESSTWYLGENGSISTSIPAKRVEGDWEYLSIGQDDDPETKAREKFKENISSHKIEFYSDRDYNLWDTIHLKIDNDIMESKIVAIISSSETDRKLYKCGDLATTLTEKVNKKK